MLFRDQKGASALRDDIAAFARLLLNLLEEKKSLTQSLLDNENEIISKLISNDHDGAEDLLVTNNELIEQIDLINYDMSENRRSLSAILGVEQKNVDKTLSEDDSKEGKTYRSLLDATDKILVKCVEQSDEITRLINQELHNTESSIRACQSLQRVRELTGISFES
jgi:hypothetical protein